jgi:hypothetical protein
MRPRHEPASEKPILEPQRRDPDPVRLAMQWVASDPASRIIGTQPSTEDMGRSHTSPHADESHPSSPSRRT